MALLDPHFYEQWRERAHARAGLREARAGDMPPERLLQQIWFYQRIRRDDLRTIDGKRVRVIHPGFWNKEPGPDFRNAIVQFDDSPARIGDIEIDLQASGWRGHGHATNANYKSVILHIVWEAPANAAFNHPRLALKNFLDAPLAELEKWLMCEPVPIPGALKGQCGGPLQSLPEPIRAELLDQAAVVRFRRKAAQIEARARQRGWDQALWEELLGALGYKHNTWPMRRVAELAPLDSTRKLSSRDAEARYLGIANLLPGEIAVTKTESDRHARLLWDHWWRQADGLDPVPKQAWKFAGLRPANHPARRLALAAQWASNGSIAQRLEQWLLTKIETAELESSLTRVLAVEENEFWSRHWTFRSKATKTNQPLLGSSRATDLAINVILPWLWIRAAAGRNEALQAEAERRYVTWPPAQDNAVLKLARARLFNGRVAVKTAAHQQGLIQIVRDFCDHSNAACEHCRFPDLVRAAAAAASSVSATEAPSVP
ncbi:MAG TPA: DUF2851 family protein [Verrucomicrobiae bacterium]